MCAGVRVFVFVFVWVRVVTLRVSAYALQPLQKMKKTKYVVIVMHKEQSGMHNMECYSYFLDLLAGS